jgi:hypothetical protein
LEAPSLETNIWQYYKGLNGNPNGVPVVVIGYSDITGSYSGSGGVYDTGYQAMVDFIAQHNLTYPMWIENAQGNGLGVTLFGTTGYPNNVIINGIPNDPNHQQWEIIYKGAGYADSLIGTYKSAIDEIAPNDKPMLSIMTNQTAFSPGDTLNADLRVQYYGPNSSFDYYAALLAFGNLFFYPSWTSQAHANTLIVSSGFDTTYKMLENIPISKDIPEGRYSLLTIAAETGTLNPIGQLVQQDFKVMYKVISKLGTSFKDNPVFPSGSPARFHFTIYLENKGNNNITIDSFNIDYYDAAGLFTSTQDASADFAEWFSLPGNLIPVGFKAEVSILSIGAGSPPTEKGAEFDFVGHDERNQPVEIRSERLLMKILTPGE